MAKKWHHDIDLTFREKTLESERNRLIASHALAIFARTGKTKVNILVDGGIRVEAYIQNHIVRIMECIAEIPLERRIGRFEAVK